MAATSSASGRRWRSPTMTEVPPARRSLINSRVIPEASCVRICVSFSFYCLVRKYSYLIPHRSALHISHTNRILAWSGNRNMGDLYGQVACRWIFLFGVGYRHDLSCGQGIFLNRRPTLLVTAYLAKVRWPGFEFHGELSFLTKACQDGQTILDSPMFHRKDSKVRRSALGENG